MDVRDIHGGMCETGNPTRTSTAIIHFRGQFTCGGRGYFCTPRVYQHENSIALSHPMMWTAAVLAQGLDRGPWNHGRVRMNTAVVSFLGRGVKLSHSVVLRGSVQRYKGMERLESERGWSKHIPYSALIGDRSPLSPFPLAGTLGTENKAYAFTCIPNRRH